MAGEAGGYLVGPRRKVRTASNKGVRTFEAAAMSGSEAHLESFATPLSPPFSWGPSSGPTAIERLTFLLLERRLARVGLSGLEATLSRVGPETVLGPFESDPAIRELVVVRTCQRVLVMAVTQNRAATTRLIKAWGPSGPWEERRDADAIRELFQIAAGLDSPAQGEREIRDQLRAAASHVASRHARPILRTLLDRSTQAAASADGPNAASVADLAVDWLRPRLTGGRSGVLVVGAGKVGRRVAERLAKAAQVTLVYRNRSPDAEWSRRLCVRAMPSEAVSLVLPQVDAVVTAAKSTGLILAVRDLPSDPGVGPRWFVDLGLPRNIEPEVASRPGAELVDLGGLPRGALPAPRLEELRRAVETAASEATQEFCRAAAEPWIAELHRWAEGIRRNELARAAGHAGELSEEARVAVERLSERLVRRLLAGATEELRSLPPGPEADPLRRRVLEILRAPDLGS